MEPKHGQLNQLMNNTFRIFERKIIIRRIYGPVFIDGEWKRRSNKEIDELLSHENLVGLIKAMRIRWLRHNERMSEERMPKMILNAKIDSGRRRGRPRKRWMMILKVI